MLKMKSGTRNRLHLANEIFGTFNCFGVTDGWLEEFSFEFGTTVLPSSVLEFRFKILAWPENPKSRNKLKWSLIDSLPECQAEANTKAV